MTGVEATVAASGSTAAAAAAIVQAIKASGAIIRLEPEEFDKIISKSEAPLVVTALGGFFTKHHQYITNYKGLHFYCKSEVPIRLPSDAEVVQAKKIWIPS